MEGKSKKLSSVEIVDICGFRTDEPIMMRSVYSPENLRNLKRSQEKLIQVGKIPENLKKLGILPIILLLTFQKHLFCPNRYIYLHV